MCISENILLAQELVKNYHRKDGNPQCTMKINLMKAYDSVDWQFIIHCLTCFGFRPSSQIGLRFASPLPSSPSLLMGLWWNILKGLEA